MYLLLRTNIDHIYIGVDVNYRVCNYGSLAFIFWSTNNLFKWILLKF